ncbi:MAG: phosphoglucosamine mutase [Magnetococcus sp. MYC-9]
MTDSRKHQRKLFGTDGVRSRANLYPMTAELVLQLGRAAGVVFRGQQGLRDRRQSVVIGKDTRLSGYMFESALRAGFTSMGIHCIQVGSLPTPAIAFLTRALRADAGVMISASHNPFYDNGIKFFSANGMKLPDSVEVEIERLLFEGDLERYQPSAHALGKATIIEDAGGRYIEFCKNCFPKELRLDGLRLVVDCAHGASYKVAPAVFWELGAEVVPIGNAPDGYNINDGFGALHPEAMQKKVLEVRADIGVAFDGDADRLLVCDEKGRILNGDHVLAMSALAMQQEGTLRGGAVVATVMSNLGLERLLAQHDLRLIRAQVGDRYVLDQMVQQGCNLGGEQSGHMIFLDKNTTGDGIVSALKILELMASSRRPLSALITGMESLPQVLQNVVVPPNKDPLSNPLVQAAIAETEQLLAGAGRLLVRKSGTEPIVRVMLEGDNQERIEEMAAELCRVIQRVVGMDRDE